ncbi:redoxin domain-containing protein [Rheinheimera riviphila]|uniref:Redoxin domain-containing protein n=1 Tax=Rheinheimera riviphila TaxID=1834037 RepID=A0A437R234_9GAMM|nr:redoxin family protein [Rheinheimera riviphila]RVU40772.1 redoxin domain-containing protein [Rheinheimera riviphila]
MKKMFSLLIWISYLALATPAMSADFASVQLQQFPTLQPVSLQGLNNGKPSYVKLWASWCQPCLEQMPHFQKLQQSYGDKVNFVAINININEERDAIRQVIKRFGLTMPVWLDQQGKIALALGLVGTPMSVLINSQGQQVYSTHESDQALDTLLAKLAAGQQLPPADNSSLSIAAQQQLLAPFTKGEHLLFFSASWCDWYLAESRPAMSAHCKVAQQGLNKLAAEFPAQHWQGVVNHLWTDDKALNDFIALYQLKVPFQIDSGGVLFQHFNVREIPVLLKIKDGKTVARITDFNDMAKVRLMLQQTKAL